MTRLRLETSLYWSLESHGLPVCQTFVSRYNHVAQKSIESICKFAKNLRKWCDVSSSTSIALPACETLVSFSPQYQQRFLDRAWNDPARQAQGIGTGILFLRGA